MQFAYQFPERCERLVLVSSGGLGRDVHLVLRAAALPGADYVLPLLTDPRLLGVGRGLGGLLRRARLAPSGDVDVLARGVASLDNAASRQAFLHTIRAVIEPGGQRVSAHDRLELAAMPGSRLEIFPRAGHMPHDADPERFAALLTDFCNSTDAAQLPADHWQPLLRRGD
jgi:pimeloyl-ACP methyl ester carboxylesterase